MANTEIRLDQVETSFKVLITGFGPFKSHPVNASWEAVSRLPDRIPDTNIEIIKEKIEVSYSYVDSTVPQLWSKHAPSLVIHVGVSENARDITIESCGHKDKYDKLDIHQERPCEAQCKAAEACQYTFPIGQLKSELDLEKLISEFVENKAKLNESLKVDISRVGIMLSSDAGRYLCEYIYFTSLCVDNTRCVFIHVPCIDTPYSLQELADSLLCIIFILAQELKSGR